MKPKITPFLAATSEIAHISLWSNKLFSSCAFEIACHPQTFLNSFRWLVLSIFYLVHFWTLWWSFRVFWMFVCYLLLAISPRFVIWKYDTLISIQVFTERRYWFKTSLWELKVLYRFSRLSTLRHTLSTSNLFCGLLLRSPIKGFLGTTKNILVTRIH